MSELIKDEQMKSQSAMFEPKELLWNKYKNQLELAIIGSRFYKRAEIKPMSTPKGADESHITSRANHQLLAAKIAARIASELRLK